MTEETSVLDEGIDRHLGMSRVKWLIRAAGRQPESFASAHEFLTRPRTPVPCRLILDVSPPRLNDLALEERLAAERSDTPIIFLSRHCDKLESYLSEAVGTNCRQGLPPQPSQLALAAAKISVHVRRLRRMSVKLRVLSSLLLLSVPACQLGAHKSFRGRMVAETPRNVRGRLCQISDSEPISCPPKSNQPYVLPFRAGNSGPQIVATDGCRDLHRCYRCRTGWIIVTG
jgi:hypothetical protein